MVHVYKLNRVNIYYSSVLVALEPASDKALIPH